MNNMQKKLIKDGNMTRRAKINLISVGIGALLVTIGLLLLAVKALSVEYIDANDILHENFFLLPIGFLFIMSGIIIFCIIGIKIISFKIKN